MNKIRKYYKFCKTDFSGGVQLIWSYIMRDYGSYLYSYMNLWLKFKGCKLHKGVKFWKSPLVVRYPNSTIEIGENCLFVSSSYNNYRGINHRCILNTGAENAIIKIGDNCGFSGVSIVADNKVVIGNNVTIGANTIIGDRDDHSDLYNSKPAPVIIDNNVWIGMHCIILKGVHIEANSIIGAGSIVTKDIPANSIAAGVPCKVIKQRYAEHK